MIQAMIETTCPSIGKSIVDLPFKSNVIISSIEKDGKFFTPDGMTKIQTGDRLSVLADNPVAVFQFYKVLGIRTWKKEQVILFRKVISDFTFHHFTNHFLQIDQKNIAEKTHHSFEIT